ncbi:DoxX family protein [Roseomonas eburnea]|uniref:DoxX family protein n=1 Tax=Neoroseomonas eburnea TaxID=1346889 RepID=A0A9X9XDS2_9PROT|nr:DoxX family protein [Neoroseomonas eburnea]MBR0681858.1 DoxX family protein [Neoroseomonas eburnea]
MNHTRHGPATPGPATANRPQRGPARRPPRPWWKAGGPLPALIALLLDSRSFDILARVLLTFAFWTGGFAKLFDFGENAAMMESFGLQPGWAVNLVVLVVQIGASLLIILDRGTWLAAGALAVFTVLTVPIAHPFWAKEGEDAFRDLTVAVEHVSVIGGLAVCAILSRRRALRHERNAW